jgi:hypothetical protein
LDPYLTEHFHQQQARRESGLAIITPFERLDLNRPVQDTAQTTSRDTQPAHPARPSSPLEDESTSPYAPIADDFILDLDPPLESQTLYEDELHTLEWSKDQRSASITYNTDIGSESTLDENEQDTSLPFSSLTDPALHQLLAGIELFTIARSADTVPPASADTPPVHGPSPRYSCTSTTPVSPLSALTPGEASIVQAERLAVHDTALASPSSSPAPSEASSGRTEGYTVQSAVDHLFTLLGPGCDCGMHLRRLSFPPQLILFT